jgi:hypothetical protein
MTLETRFKLNQEHFMSYLSVSDYLLACKEERAREFATYLFTALFEEFSDTYSRQEVFCLLASPSRNLFSLSRQLLV